tara:strand:+ start:218 stop:772 length:555 start_codon:yes stop_codon:yes gene_type:complete
LAENKIIRNQINLAKKNNQKAFSFLLNKFWDDVYNFQLKRINNETNAEDITIESFTRAFEKINTYNEKYLFKTWLITISKNLHIDQLRKNKNSFNDLDSSIFHQIVETSPSPEDDLINEQKLNTLKKNIDKLKPVYRKAIKLRFFEELSYKEIAFKLDQPINNIKVRIMRAKRILSTIIESNDL